MTEPVREPPDVSVTFNLKAILGALAALTPLVVGLTMLLQMQQNVRDNTRRQISNEQENARRQAATDHRLNDLEARLREVERAKLTYCISRAADSVSVRNAPDAGC